MIKVLGRGKWTTCKIANSQFQIELQILLLDKILKDNLEKECWFKHCEWLHWFKDIHIICLFSISVYVVYINMNIFELYYSTCIAKTIIMFNEVIRAYVIKFRIIQVKWH